MNSNCQPPICLALVLADAIHRDPGTHKRTILGTFSAIFSNRFPFKQNIAVYCALTDGRGTPDVEVSVVHADGTDDPIAKATGKIDFSDPRMVVELDLGMNGLVFPRPGEYRIIIVAAGEFLMERRLVVVHVAAPEGQENDSGDA